MNGWVLKEKSKIIDIKYSLKVICSDYTIPLTKVNKQDVYIKALIYVYVRIYKILYYII